MNFYFYCKIPKVSKIFGSSPDVPKLYWRVGVPTEASELSEKLILFGSSSAVEQSAVKMQLSMETSIVLSGITVKAKSLLTCEHRGNFENIEERRRD